MPSTSPSDLRVRLLRNYVIALFVQVAATILALFLISRVAIPWLVDRQDTALLWVAGALALACPLLLVQLGYSLWRSHRRLRGRLRELAADAEGGFGGLLN